MKIVVRVATVVGTVVALMLASTVAAFACHNTVTATTSCNHDTGRYDVTWTIRNSESQDSEVLSDATRAAAQLNGRTIHGGGTATATESVAPGSGTLTLAVTGRWPSRSTTTTNSGTVTVPSAGCVQTRHVTVAASFTDQACQSDGGYTPPSYTAPEVAGTTRHVTGSATPGTSMTVAYVAGQDTVIDGTASFQHSFPATPAGPEDCRLIAVPQGPSVTQSECDSNANPSHPTLTFPGDDAFTYTAAPSGPYRAGETVTVTAVLRDATHQVVTADSLASGWSYVDDHTATLTMRFAPVACPAPPVCTACHLPLRATRAPAVTHCTGILANRTLNQVVVPAGRSCVLVNSYVNGSVVTRPGAHDLTMGNVDVRGDVRAVGLNGDFTYGAVGSVCRFDPRVGGSIIARNDHNVLICNAEVCHQVDVQHSDGKITVRATRSRRLVVTGNRHYVSDGTAHHKHGSWIRLRDDRAHVFVVKGNAPRHVDKVRLHRVGRLGGGKVCTV